MLVRVLGANPGRHRRRGAGRPAEREPTAAARRARAARAAPGARGAAGRGARGVGERPAHRGVPAAKGARRGCAHRNARGYRLTTDVDAQRFCRAVAHRAALAEALALWFGPAFDEFAHEEWAAGEAARLTELHAGATEGHAEELVTARRWSDAVALLAEHVASNPLRDSARGLLLRALAGAGRQAEALAAYRD